MEVVKKVVCVIITSLIFGYGLKAQDGEAMFKQKCAACHRTDSKRMVGPGLEGINDKRSQEWLISWIKDSQALINTGDADAVAVYEEYNKVMMTPFLELSDDEVVAILDFLGGSGDEKDAATESVPEKPIVYAPGDAEKGMNLFTGSTKFINGGPSCVTCHNVTNDQIIPGGMLAKDLTNVFDRMGYAGVTGIIGSPPFPAMANSYGENPLTEEEIHQLGAFFKQADEVSSTQSQNSGYGIFAGGGVIGLLFILLIVSLLWNKRKKESTKKDIFDRQIKARDAKF